MRKTHSMFYAYLQCSVASVLPRGMGLSPFFFNFIFCSLEREPSLWENICPWEILRIWESFPGTRLGNQDLWGGEKESTFDTERRVETGTYHWEGRKPFIQTFELLKDHWNHWDCEVKMHEGAVLTEVSPIIHGGGWAQLASSDAWTSERVRNFSPSFKLPSRSIPIPLLAIMIITIIITILTIDADTQRASSERLSNRKRPKQESYAQWNIDGKVVWNRGNKVRPQKRWSLCVHDDICYALIWHQYHQYI